MRPKRTTAIALLQLVALSSAGSVAAVDAHLSLAAQTEYNSNYLSLTEDPEPSFRGLFGPVLSLVHTDGRLAYDVIYSGSYAAYIHPWRDELNKWEQSVRGQIVYDLSPTTTVTVVDSFHDQVAIQISEVEQDDLTDTLDGGRDPFYRNSFALSLEHAFGPRLAGALSLQNDWVNFERNINQSDSVSMSTGGEITYAINRSDRVGLGGAFSYQSYKGQDVRVPGSRGRIYNVFALWEHRFDKDFRITLSAGPTLIETAVSKEVQVVNFGAFAPGGVVDPNDPVLQFIEFDSSCIVVPGSATGLESACQRLTPPLPLGDGPQLAVVRLPFVGSSKTERDQTFFARFVLSKAWDNLALTIRYNRSQSNAAGDGGTSTLDRILLRADYDANRLWAFYGAASWNRRLRATQPVFAADFLVVDGGPEDPGLARRVQVIQGRGSRKSGTNQATVVVGASRRFTQKLTGNLEFQYRYQFTTRATQQDREVNFFLLNARFNYSFDPVRL